MTDVYETLEKTLLREFDEVDRNEVINDVLNYTLPNFSEPTDYSLWATGTSDFLKDNHNMLQEWDKMKSAKYSDETDVRETMKFKNGDVSLDKAVESIIRSGREFTMPNGDLLIEAIRDTQW